MTTFEPGEIVTITIKGARVTNSYPRRELRAGSTAVEATVLVADYVDGNERSVAINLSAPSVTVERVASAEWPPRPGDLWRDRRGELWFCTSPSGFCVNSSRGNENPKNLLHDHGPLALVHREPQDGAP